MSAAKEAVFREIVTKDPWNASAWDGLVNAAVASGNISRQRQVLDELLTQFPYAVRFCEKQA